MKKQPTMADIILNLYPKAIDCASGHIGKTVKTFFREEDDDRYRIVITPRCDHCNMPNGGDQYADGHNQERYYKGLQPDPQV